MVGQNECPTPSDLSAFGRGELEAEPRSAIESHLLTCPVCQSALLSINPKFAAGFQKTNIGYKTPSPAAASGPDTPESPPTLSVPKAQPEAQAILDMLQPPQEPDELGRVGGYRLLKHIGTGGMGMVFLAEDLVLRRPTALKIMRPETQTSEGWARLLREARSMASIKHAHLATVYQAGRESEVFYLAMELLEGKPLDNWVGAGRPEVPDILRLAKEIAAGLSAIHVNGLIHRDIKPSNIWIETPGNIAKILDFGLARPVAIKGSTFVTQAGIIAGTPAFMSPEQARTDTLDPRSDLFSYGGVLYFLCTGDVPFVGEDIIALLTALAVDTPKRVRSLNPEIPLALSDLIAQLLEKKPDARPASAQEVLRLLEHIEAGPSHTKTLLGKPVAAKVAPPAPAKRRTAPFVLVALALAALASPFLFPGLLLKAHSPVVSAEKNPEAVAPEKPAPEKIASTPPVPADPAPAPAEKKVPIEKVPPLLKEIALDLGGAKMDLLLVPAGDFLMGDDNGPQEERPAHKVQISRAFYIAKFETTVAQFRAFAEATKYRTEAETRGKAWPVVDGKMAEVPGIFWRNPGFEQNDTHPACVLTWNDANEYCKWASDHIADVLKAPSPAEKWVIRLPTEAEWEYAARGPGDNKFPWGHSWDSVRANVADASLKAKGYPMRWGEIKENDGFPYTAPVGSFQNASWVGAFDMCGNVWEWCADQWDKNYYPVSPHADPPGSMKGMGRIYRGGCWDGTITSTTRRGNQYSAYPASNIGFRAIAAVVEPDATRINKNNLGARLKLVGEAVDTRSGPMLIGIGFSVFMERNSWPDGFYLGGDHGKRVSVGGTLGEDNALPVFIPIPGEETKGGIPVPPGTDLHEASHRFVLKNATWTLLENK